MSTLDPGPPPPLVAPRHTTRGYRYPGSPPFGDSDLDRLVFRGRESEAGTVLHSILSFDLFVIFGASGMGKTSLLNAGVLQELRERGLWPFVVRLHDPDSRPIDLVRSSLEAAAQADDAVEVTNHPAADGAPPDSLWDLFSALEVWRGNELQRPVAVFDQFEELFTLGFPEHVRQEFIAQLGELVRRHRVADDHTIDLDTGRLPDPDAKVVLVLREDSLGELDALSTHVPQIMRHRFRVQGLTPEQAKSAILEPAASSDPRLRSHRFSYADDAADLLLQFLRSREVRGETRLSPRVDPSQLQIICQHVERFILPGKAAGADDEVEITPEDLGGEQGLNNILRDFYQREIAALDPEDQQRARALCEGGLISRSGRRLSLEEGEIEETWGVSRRLLDELIDRRLLRAEPRVGSVYYELAHDTLVAGILEQARAWLTVREREERALSRAGRLDRWSLGLGIANLAVGWLAGPLLAVAILALRSPPRQRGGRWRSQFGLVVALLWSGFWALSAVTGVYDGEPPDFTLPLFGIFSVQPLVGAAIGLAWPVPGDRTSRRWRWTLGATLLGLFGVALVGVLLSEAVVESKFAVGSSVVASSEASIVVGGGAITNGTVELDVPAGASVQQFLEVTAGRRLVIDVIGSGGFDPVLVLRGEGGVQVATDDDGGGNLDARLELELAPGSYTLEVFEFAGDAGTATIEVATPGVDRAARAAAGDDADPNEPNDTAIDATPVGTAATGAIVPGDDHDWFLLRHDGGRLEVSTSGCEQDGSDTFLTLWQGDGATPVASNDDSGDGDGCSTIVVGDLPAGDYYVSVDSFDPAVPVPSYVLTVDRG